MMITAGFFKRLPMVFLALAFSLALPHTACGETGDTRPIPHPTALEQRVVDATVSEIRAFELRVFELTNIERAQYGLPPLIWHDTLSVSARGHAEDLLRNDMRGHTGSDGSTLRQRTERAGITNARYWAENVSYGRRTPEATVDGWMNSPGHRANILSEKPTHLGVGFIQRTEGITAQYATYVVQNFCAFKNSGGASTPSAVTPTVVMGAPAEKAAAVKTDDIAEIYPEYVKDKDDGAAPKKIAVYVTGAKTRQANIKEAMRVLREITDSGKYQAIERPKEFLNALAVEQDKQRGALSDEQIKTAGVRFGADFICVADVSGAIRIVAAAAEGNRK